MYVTYSVLVVILNSHSICRLLPFSWIAKFNTKYTPYAKYHARPNQNQLLNVFHRFCCMYNELKGILRSCIENPNEKVTFTNRDHSESFHWYVEYSESNGKWSFSVVCIFSFSVLHFWMKNELKAKIEGEQEKEEEEVVIFRCYIVCCMPVDDTLLH